MAKDIDIERVRNYAKRHKAKECAEKFKISLNSFYRIAHINNIEYVQGGRGGSTCPKDLKAKILDYMPTHSVSDTARRFGVSENYVRGLSKYYDIKCQRKKSQYAKRDMKILQLVQEKTYAEVGKKFGITRQRVEQIVNRKKRDAVNS